MPDIKLWSNHVYSLFCKREIILETKYILLCMREIKRKRSIIVIIIVISRKNIDKLDIMDDITFKRKQR